MASLALSRNTLDTFGINRSVTARVFLRDESESLPLIFTANDTPLNISNYTFTFRLIKQTYQYASESKGVYSITGREDDPTATEINLDSHISITDGPNGKALIVFPDTLTAVDRVNDKATIYAGYWELNDHASVGATIQKFPVCVVVQ